MLNVRPWVNKKIFIFRISLKCLVIEKVQLGSKVEVTKMRSKTCKRLFIAFVPLIQGIEKEDLLAVQQVLNISLTHKALYLVYCI